MAWETFLEPQTRSHFHPLSEEVWGKDGVPLVVPLPTASSRGAAFLLGTLAPFSTALEGLTVKKVTGRRHQPLVLALLLTKDDGNANGAPSET